MKETLLNWLASFPDWLSVILLSALPVTELRVSLPIALFYYDLPVWESVILSAIGNIIPLPAVFFIIPPFLIFAESRSPALHRFFQNQLRWLEQKYADRYHAYGALFLFLFVAVPFPGSGVWTGSLLAVIFGMKPRYSVPAILFGMLASALIVLILSLYASSV
jgi:uncharacterized membrane protein